MIQLDDKVVQVCADVEHVSSGRDDELNADTNASMVKLMMQKNEEQDARLTSGEHDAEQRSTEIFEAMAAEGAKHEARMEIAEGAAQELGEKLADDVEEARRLPRRFPILPGFLALGSNAPHRSFAERSCCMLTSLWQRTARAAFFFNTALLRLRRSTTCWRRSTSSTSTSRRW